LPEYLYRSKKWRVAALGWPHSFFPSNFSLCNNDLQILSIPKLGLWHPWVTISRVVSCCLLLYFLEIMSTQYQMWFFNDINDLSGRMGIFSRSTPVVAWKLGIWAPGRHEYVIIWDFEKRHTKCEVRLRHNHVNLRVISCYCARAGHPVVQSCIKAWGDNI